MGVSFYVVCIGYAVTILKQIKPAARTDVQTCVVNITAIYAKMKGVVYYFCCHY